VDSVFVKTHILEPSVMLTYARAITTRSPIAMVVAASVRLAFTGRSNMRVVLMVPLIVTR